MELPSNNLGNESTKLYKETTTEVVQTKHEDTVKIKQGLNVRLAFAIAAGAFGSAFQHGYNTGVVNAPQDLIMQWIQNCQTSSDGDNATMATQGTNTSITISDQVEDCALSAEKTTVIWALIVSLFCVGGMIGGSIVGVVSSRVGRKGGLLLNNILVLIGGLLMLGSKFSGSYEMLMVGRLVIGINAGLNAGLAPMYLSEISPTSLRGAVGTVYQLIITISILLSQIFGMSNVLGNEAGWPWLFFLTVIPGLLQLLTLPFCPESPKYLLLDKDDEGRATNALTWLRGNLDVRTEMDEMRVEQERMKLIPRVTSTEMVRNVSLRQPLIIAMMMMLAQQLTGINAAIFYSTSIFKSAGLSVEDSQAATLGMGAMNVAMTFVSLALIEKAGRKTLMLVGLGVMLVATTLLLICLLAAHAAPALSYVSIIMVIGFIIGFATGPGSIPWFFVTELFNQSGRPMATSIAVVTNWVANFMVGLGFAPLQLLIGPYVFIFFIVMQILFIIYVSVKVPETKNKTIEEITAQFRQYDVTERSAMQLDGIQQQSEPLK